ncbi:MAG TPA: hypothetical protein VFA83_17665 [Acidimicrobiales bacterium]|nr:hypothetical protein [Acidimicrobiales bacterium]
MTRRQAVLAGLLAVLVLAGAITLLVARGRDHRAPHRLLAGDTAPSTTSSTELTTTTDLPATTTARAAATTPLKRTATTAPGGYAGPRGGIAFVSGEASTGTEGISVMDADGTHLRRIADFDQARTASRPDSPWFGGNGFSGLAWSPAGDLIAAGRDGKYGGGLEVMRPDGSGRRTLVFDSGVEHPTFSPDGRWIAYDNPGAHLATSGPGQVMVIGVDGHDQHPLGTAVTPGDPAWSPDGTLIAIESGDHLTLVRPDGTVVQSIPAPANTSTSSPAWSPDGQWISFTAVAPTTTPDYTADIFELHPDGSGLVRVTDNHDYSTGASWSPEGARLVFTRSTPAAGGSSPPQLWTVQPDGDGQRPLPAGPDSASQPAWR